MGCSFYKKNNLKSEKSLTQKVCVITKTLNWEVSTKNLVNFEVKDVVKDGKF